MLDDIKIEEDGLVTELTRPITVIEEDPLHALPAIVIDGTFLKRDTLRKLTKTLLGKKDVSDAEEQRFRCAVVDATWRNWSGVTLQNMARVSEYVLFNYGSIKKFFEGKNISDTDELAWDITDAKWFAKHLNGQYFQLIFEELQKTEEFANRRIEVEKNS